MKTYLFSIKKEIRHSFIHSFIYDERHETKKSIFTNFNSLGINLVQAQSILPLLKKYFIFTKLIWFIFYLC